LSPKSFSLPKLCFGHKWVKLAISEFALHWIWLFVQFPYSQSSCIYSGLHLIFIKVQKIDSSRGSFLGKRAFRLKNEQVWRNIFHFGRVFLLWNPIFGPFRYTGSWKEVEKVEEIHCDEAEQKGKEKSVDACGGSDDDIHGGGISSENRRRFLSHWNFWSKKSLANFHATLIYQFRTSLFVGRAESRKKHLEFWERFAIDSN
jgi:hypothetical protein